MFTSKTGGLEPYRILMPLGGLLVIVGSGVWTLFALGVTSRFPAAVHAVVQTQGFVTAFILGFLFTMLPKRTRSAPAQAWHTAVAALGCAGVSVLSFMDRLALGQLCWIVAMVVALRFTLPRLFGKSRKRPPPVAFILLPIGLAAGIAGSLATLAASGPFTSLHLYGHKLLSQAMPLLIIVAIAPLALPVMTHGEATADCRGLRKDIATILAYLGMSVGLIASIVIELEWSWPLAMWLRAALVTAGLAIGARGWRPPSKSGTTRWLIWLSSWMLTVGYAAAAVCPVPERTAWLHITYLAGIALLILSVGMQVVLGHGGHERDKNGMPWPVIVFGMMTLIAACARIAMLRDIAHYLRWLGLSSAIFAVGVAIWFGYSVLRLARNAAE